MSVRSRLVPAVFRLCRAPLLIALSGLILSLLPVLTQLEEEFDLGLLYRLRGAERPPEDIVIVGIDHDSALRLQTPNEPQSWPRRLNADVIRNVQASEVELLAFNVFFFSPASDLDDDRVMADAMRRMRSVVLTDYVKPRQVYAGVYLESVIHPTDTLAGAALATAPFLLPKDDNGINRFLVFFGEENQATLPTRLLLAYAWRTAHDDLVGAFMSAAPDAAGFLKRQPMEREQFDALQKDLTALLQSRADLLPILEKDLQQRSIPEKIRQVLRSLLRAHENTGARYFNHYGPARTFPTIPYYQLVASPPAELKRLLKGKIVLVGYLEDFQPENTEGLFHSPYSTISSVELAATALANLLEGKSVLPALTPLKELIWLVLWGLALGSCAQLLSVQRALTLIAALSGGYLLTAWALFRANGLWLPLLIPLIWQAPAASMGCLLLSYLRRVRREEKMQSVIERFIPVDVFSQLTRDEDIKALPSYGRLARGICLATDAGRYSSLAETMEPMALADLMNDYYRILFQPVSRHGGWISDVIGDAMLAIWTAEGDDSETRRNVLQAALEIQQAVRRFERYHGLDFPVRIGIHCGDLRIGYVGTDSRGEIRAIGDTVNIAARLEALNKILGTEILVSEAVLAGVAEDRARRLGQFLLAGKMKPVSVAELISRSGWRAPHLQEFNSRFQTALAHFEAERWPEAHAAFAQLVLQLPDDGPARFYLKTCEARLGMPHPAGTQPPGIRIEKSDAAHPLTK
ncbi:adenylate/guanylate cyclase domain-containing protein [Methylocaldum sp.]|uniref:adenylate/guanylate cyclase domain-containing protein n=1 Tax=Methylocaldum sp. TaxID=1969727 RepID=UPI002D411D8A|nr:adenylate/guanylate cyclase domain-containing protein [Methylocaldum sp.]HYE35776.1 adenylate/guanylate cyclase domain-containing protein [Methylocaldum sp.]